MSLRELQLAELNARTAYNNAASNDDVPENKLAELRRAFDDATAELRRELEKPEVKPDIPPEPSLPEIRMANYLSAYSQGRPLTGAEKEANEELGLNVDFGIPFQALLPDEAEKRADVATETSNLPDNDNLHEIMGRVFERSATAKLGIMMPGVQPGDQDYPVMTTGTTAAPVAEGDGHDAAAAEFTTVTVKPTRITGRYLFTLEDVARLGGQIESALRDDLRQVLSDQLDTQIISGNGTAPNFSGLEKLLAITAPAGNAAVATFDDLKDIVLGGLDDKFAGSESDVRVMLGLNSYKFGRKLYRTATTDGPDAIAAMRALGAMVDFSGKITSVETAAASSKKADYEAAIRNAEPGAAVAPVWQGIQLIRDPYTNASEGQIALTFNMLAGFALKRADAWARVPVVYNSKAA